MLNVQWKDYGIKPDKIFHKFSVSFKFWEICTKSGKKINKSQMFKVFSCRAEFLEVMLL